MQKSELRKIMRERKRQFSSEELRKLSLPIVRQLLENPHVKAARTVIMYHSLPDEVFTHDAIDIMKAEGKEVLLPISMPDGTLRLTTYEGRDSLTTGLFGIKEPSAGITPSTCTPIEGQPTEAKQPILLDKTAHFVQQNGPFCSDKKPICPDKDVVIVVPGVAFDASGKRLGRGKGYYDRLLADMPDVYKIGLCFDFQMVDSVPTDDNDVSMNEVISSFKK